MITHFDKNLFQDTRALVLISLIYLAMTFVLPTTYILFWLTILIIVLNFTLSLIFLFRQGTITLDMIILNVVQLALFCRLHVLIHDSLGADHYAYAIGYIPRWYDWVELVAVHVLRAVDLLDIFSAYGISLQNVTHQSVLAGTTLFVMHIMVDIFLLGALFMVINRHMGTHSSVGKQGGFGERFKSLLNFLNSIRHWALGVAFVLIIIVGIVQEWSVSDWFLWPLDNFLRMLDLGDAFQIFEWQLHSLKMGIGFATLAVFFRLMVSFYAFVAINRFYLSVFGGRGKTLEELAQICASSEYSEEVHHIAAQELVKYGPKAVNPLITALVVSNNPDDRRTFIEALGELGPTAVPAIPQLVKLLIDSDSSVRWATNIALEERIAPQWWQSESAINSIPYLVKTLVEGEIPKRRFAADILGKMRDVTAIPHLEKALTDDSQDLRSSAAEALGKIGEVTTIPSLVRALTDSKAAVRSAASVALDKIDPQWWQNDAARHAIPQIVAGKDHVFYTTVAALRAKVEPQWLSSKSACNLIPELFKGMTDNENDIRHSAVTILEKMVPQWWKSAKARHLIPHFVKALTSNNSGLCRIAEETLEKIDPHWAQSDEARHITPKLIKALTDESQDSRQSTMAILEKIAPEWWKKAQRFIPHFVNALGNNNVGVHNAAEAQLKKIDPDWQQTKEARYIFQEFIKALTFSENYQDRQAAAEKLGNMGSVAASALSALLKALVTDSDNKVRFSVAKALNKIDPQYENKWWYSDKARSFIPFLVITMVESEGLEIRNAAEKALEGIDLEWSKSEEARQVLDELVVLSRQGKGLATEILRKMGRPPRAKPRKKVAPTPSINRWVSITPVIIALGLLIGLGVIFTNRSKSSLLHSPTGSSVQSVSFSRDGNTFASGYRDGTLGVWEASTGEQLHILTPSKAPVNALSFSPDNQTLASGYLDGTIMLWDVSTGEQQQTLTGRENWLRSLSFSPDGSTLASGYNNGTIKLWEVSTGKQQRTLSGAKNIVWLSLNESTLTSASSKPDQNTLTITRWDVNSGQGQEIFTTNYQALSFSPDGNMLATLESKDDNFWAIQIWNVNTGEQQHSLEMKKKRAIQFGEKKRAFDDDIIWLNLNERTLTLVHFRNYEKRKAHYITLWNISTGERLHTEGSKCEVKSAWLNSDDSMLAFVCQEGSINLLPVH